MNTNKITTRKQLQGCCATRYQAEALTKHLTPVAKQGRAYAYSISDVIVSTREYLQHSRIKPTTRQKLEIILRVLLERLSNVIEAPFSRSVDPEISKLARQLVQAASNTDSALAELKATAATIKARYST